MNNITQSTAPPGNINRALRSSAGADTRALSGALLHGDKAKLLTRYSVWECLKYNRGCCQTLWFSRKTFLVFPVEGINCQPSLKSAANMELYTTQFPLPHLLPPQGEEQEGTACLMPLRFVGDACGNSCHPCTEQWQHWIAHQGLGHYQLLVWVFFLGVSVCVCGGEKI